MPDHSVITTFTLVRFLLSLTAFTKVLVDVYTHEKFTLVINSDTAVKTSSANTA